MSCKGTKRTPQQALEARRQAIAGLFASGKTQHAIWHRLRQCCAASKCGRLCPRLVKSPGIALVECVDVVTGERVDLYDALADPDHKCPEELF